MIGIRSHPMSIQVPENHDAIALRGFILHGLADREAAEVQRK